jgi:hypothetical protein
VVINTAGTEPMGLVKTPNSVFNTLTVAKSERFLTLSLISEFCNFLILANVFWGWYAVQLLRDIPCKGGWDTGVGRSSSITGQKIKTKSEFTSM